MIDKSKVTWIDIDAPRKEHTFKDLNCESSGPKFKDLTDSSEIQVEKKNTNEKQMVLEHSLFRAVKTLFPKVVSEANNPRV